MHASYNMRGQVPLHEHLIIVNEQDNQLGLIPAAMETASTAAGSHASSVQRARQHLTTRAHMRRACLVCKHRICQQGAEPSAAMMQICLN